METDYSQLEVDNIVEELLTVHAGKLKDEELAFLTTLKGQITPQQRDVLVRLYDSIGEAGY